MRPIGRVIIAAGSGILFLSSSASCGKLPSASPEVSADQYGSGSPLSAERPSGRRPALATANRPARVSVDFQKAARSRGAGSIELTLRPEPIRSSQRYVIQVFAVGLTDEAGPESAEEYLGSYTAFAPTAAETPITMVVRTPKRLKTKGLSGVRSLQIEIRLEPVSPETRLDEAAVAVIDAKVVP